MVEWNSILSSELLDFFRVRACTCMFSCINLVKDVFVHMSSIFFKMSYDKISRLVFQKSMKYIYILAVFILSEMLSIFTSKSINMLAYFSTQKLLCCKQFYCITNNFHFMYFGDCLENTKNFLLFFILKILHGFLSFAR